MNIFAIAASQVPSDTANSIQVMKACQGLVRAGHGVQVNRMHHLAGGIILETQLHRVAPMHGEQQWGTTIWISRDWRERCETRPNVSAYERR